ncbi:MAG: hypothetical protein J1F61_06575 [Clostridiales bacterium]|nr:hypothetical protein [Clostridiales bacterium]
MNDKELQKVLNAIKYIPEERERDEVTQIILKAASESITLERLKRSPQGKIKNPIKNTGQTDSSNLRKRRLNLCPTI